MNNKFSVKQKFEGKFNEIFNKSYYPSIMHIDYGFHSIEEIEENTLLFIGLNPSRKPEETTPFENPFYSLYQQGNSNKKFFKIFEDIGIAANLVWSHLDLLVVREQKQEIILNLLKDDSGRDFLFRQLMISKQIIEAINPRIIVVANTLARLLMGKMQNDNKNVWIGYNFEFDEDFGTDIIVSDCPVKGVPVFFTSMLGEQRALDLGSRQRLIWHIKRVNEMIK